jgi:hypothetical protein
MFNGFWWNLAFNIQLWEYLSTQTPIRQVNIPVEVRP